MVNKRKKQKERCNCINCQIDALIDSLIDEMPSYEFERLKMGLINKLNIIINVDSANIRKPCIC